MSSPMPPSYPSPSPAPGGPVPAPRSLDAGAGVSWIGEGWQIFKASPGTWIAIVVLFALILVAVGYVPVVGSFAAQLLAPVLAGGAMLGCHALARGEPLAVAHLFEGFKAPHLSPLVVAGVINVAIALAVFLLFGLVFVLGAGAGAMEDLIAGDAIELGTESLLRFGVTGLLAFPVLLVGVTVLAMLWWFAPPLIAVGGLGAWSAMKTSFSACLANMLPFLLYGVVFLLLAIAASIPFGLGWLVLAPVALGSQYASWRQVFSRA